jgi:beta-galactosidase
MLRLSREIEIAAALRDGRLEIAPLRLYDLHDRAYVYVDGIPVGATGVVGNDQRPTDPATIELTPYAERLLPEGGRRTVRVDLLVESLGRVNFGPRLGERKGILGGVWQTIRFLNDWEADPWPLEDMGEELAVLLADAPAADVGEGALPVLVGASFVADAPADTFLDVSGAGHGVAYVNGFCVGRYWDIGPQQTLYVPAPLVREGRNEVLLLDLEKVPARLALAEAHRFGRGEG